MTTTWSKPKTPLFTGVNPVFQLLKVEKSRMVNHRASQVETLFEILEDTEYKIKGIGGD